MSGLRNHKFYRFHIFVIGLKERRVVNDDMDTEETGRLVNEDWHFNCIAPNETIARALVEDYIKFSPANYAQEKRVELIQAHQIHKTIIELPY